MSFTFWQKTVQDIYYNNEDWFDRAYLIDWTVATAFWVLSGLATLSPVFQREFSTDDPLISHPHTHEQVTTNMNIFLTLILPLMVTGSTGGYRGSLMEVHHGFLTVWSSRGLTRLITEFLKSSVGRLRPDFLARCRWDATVNACTGNADTILNGRRSFPSGHSSAIFASMTFISLLFAGKTAAWCYGVSCPHASIRASKLARLSLTLLPFFCAAWVAISRVEDYRHHKEDVIVGSLIGISVSTVCYLMFWPSPFNPKHFTQQRLGQPRSLYTHDDNTSRDANFELTRHEDELESV